MWDKLRRHVHIELGDLNHLLEDHRPLLLALASRPPDPIERSALAAMLHCFYTGTENLFRNIAVEFHEERPASATWHRDLLHSMAQPTPARRAVISASLREMLEDYVDFRHMFRHAYLFRLDWPKMSPLVIGFEPTLRQLESEVTAFLERLE